MTGSAQFNYLFNDQIKFYTYTGFSTWDKNNIVIREVKEVFHNDEKLFHNTYNEDNHILIPIYIGGKINLHTNSLFTSFINIELGFSFLSYNSYELWKSVDPETGEVFGYYQGMKTENKENLFGVGIGAGLSHPISGTTDLLLSFKLNSHVNEKYPGLFSRRGTYTTFTVGFNFNI